MRKHLILILICALTLSACSSFQRTSEQSFPLLLLLPSEGPKAAIYNQKLEMIAPSGNHQLLVVLKIDENEIKLRGLSAMGQTLYSLRYDGKTLIVKDEFATQLPSKDILSMLQFAIWPSQTLVNSYTSEKYWSLEIKPTYRMLSYKGKRKLKVTYVDTNTLMLENYAHKYTVKIKTLDYIEL